MIKHIAMRLFAAGLLAGVIAGGQSGFEIASAMVPQQTSTTTETYSNQITSTFLASELGIPASSIDSIVVGNPGDGCSVTFNQPIVTHRNEHRDARGQLQVTTRDQNELDRHQLRRLDEIMASVGCFRSRR